MRTISRPDQYEIERKIHFRFLVYRSGRERFGTEIRSNCSAPAQVGTPLSRSQPWPSQIVHLPASPRPVAPQFVHGTSLEATVDSHVPPQGTPLCIPRCRWPARSRCMPNAPHFPHINFGALSFSISHLTLD